MKKKIDYFDLFLKILMVLATILVVYWFIQILFGGSPTTDQFIIGIILIIVSLVIHLNYKSGIFNQFINGTFPRFEKNVEQSFNRIKEDISSLKSDTSLLKQDLNLIKKKLKI